MDIDSYKRIIYIYNMYIICIYTYRERERLILNHFEPFPLRKNVEVFTRGLN